MFLIFPHTAYCGFKEYCQDLKKNFVNTCYSNSYDLYIPAYAWHNRFAYEKIHIDKYTELPWGVGVGKSFVDAKYNWHGLYVMVFKDSNKNAQTLFGYFYLVNWFSDFKLGLGFTISFTQRIEYNYIPIPIPFLPIMGFEYKRMSLQASYLPGPKNFGNILFLWLKIAIYIPDYNL